MAISAQGTHIYFVDPTDDELITLECPTGITIPGSTTEQIDETCLDDKVARRSRGGLSTPGAITLPVNFDPQATSHNRLIALSKSKLPIAWMVGLSETDDAPTLDSAGLPVLPTDRSFWIFQGYVAETSFGAELGALVTMEFTVQVSGEIDFIPAIPTP